MQRLTALSEEEIAPIVAAYAFTEAVEGLVAATMRAGPGHAHRLKAADMSLADVERQFAIGCTRIAAALAAIERAAPTGNLAETLGVPEPFLTQTLLSPPLPPLPDLVDSPEHSSRERTGGPVSFPPE
jgi:hypothetical protein